MYNWEVSNNKVTELLRPQNLEPQLEDGRREYRIMQRVAITPPPLILSDFF